jgi:zinc protease
MLGSEKREVAMARHPSGRKAGLKIIPVIFFSLLLISPSQAGMKDQVFEAVLVNGLKVLLLENHKAPLITFQVWYRVGSRNEEWGKTGLSHMLEHMMFKGTQKVGPEDFSRIIQENGGNDNAFTSRDFTAYFENLSADRIQISLDLESDRMQNLQLREEDFRTERMVVMEERRLRTEDSPQAFLSEQLEATAFQVHPYHWPTVGWMEDLAKFSLPDLQEYYRTYYQPANAFLVVVGDFQKERLLPQIERAFGSIPRRTLPDPQRSQEPAQTGERRIWVKKEAHLPFLIMGYHVPNLRDPDSYVLEVMAAILAGGKSSRLHQSLVQDKQIAREAEAEHPLLSRDPSLFYLSVDPIPGKDVKEIEKALTQEVERLQQEPVSQQELEKAQNQLEAAFIYGQDSLFYQAMLLAQNEIALSWKAIDDYLPAIRRVTPADILRVANRYLTPDNRTAGILIPLPPPEGKGPAVGSSIKDRIVR